MYGMMYLCVETAAHPRIQSKQQLTLLATHFGDVVLKLLSPPLLQSKSRRPMACNQTLGGGWRQGSTQGVSGSPVGLPVQAHVCKVPWGPGHNPAVAEMLGHYCLHQGIVTVQGFWEKVQRNVHLLCC